MIKSVIQIKKIKFPLVNLLLSALTLLAPLSIGAGFLFYQLNSLPNRAYGFDIEFNINHLQQILSGNYVIYFVSTSREALYYYLSALVAKTIGLGASYFTLRLSSALIGLTTIALVFLLIKNLFGARAAFLGSLFLSISSYHTLLERLGYRTITLPLLLTLTSIFLFAAVEKQKLSFFIGLGFFLGLGLYSYTTFIIFPLLVFLLLLAYPIFKSKQISTKRWFKLVGVALAVFVLTAWPLISLVSKNPTLYWKRVVHRQQEFQNRRQTFPQQIGFFKDNYWRSLTMFNKKGQIFPLYDNTQPGSPYLDAISAKLLMLGLTIFLLKIKQFRYNFFLIIFFVSPILGSLMSLGFPGEVPAPARMSSALLPIFVIIGVGLDKSITWLTQKLPASWKQKTKIALFLLAMVLFLVSFKKNFQRIFVDFPATYEKVIYR